MKRNILLILIFLLIHVLASAQERKGLNPDFLVLQYAGSVGFISAGIGYDVFNSRGIVSIQFGHVPHAYGGPLNIFSTRLLFVPRRYALSDNIVLAPFDVGLMISYHLGSNFRTRWPTHRYPENYYWWQTSFRFHLDYQPSITFKLHEHTVFKAVTAYLDINANDLYLVSYLQNRRSLNLSDILKLGAGIRLHY